MDIRRRFLRDNFALSVIWMKPNDVCSISEQYRRTKSQENRRKRVLKGESVCSSSSRFSVRAESLHLFSRTVISKREVLYIYAEFGPIIQFRKKERKKERQTKNYLGFQTMRVEMRPFSLSFLSFFLSFLFSFGFPISTRGVACSWRGERQRSAESEK